MMKLCIPCRTIPIWFNLLTFYLFLIKAYSSELPPATNITYPTVVSRNDNEKCYSHRDQTTSRANTLSDDADDLQKQLENEARDRLKMGRPKTIWVLHLPRDSDIEEQLRTKRDSVKLQESKLIHHSATDEPADYSLDPSTADIEPMLNLNKYKDYMTNEQSPKYFIDSNYNFSTISTKLDQPYEFGKTYNKLKDGRFSTITHAADDIDNLTLIEHKHDKPHMSTDDADNLHKIDKLVEKARILSNAMPLTEGFNPDNIETNVVKKKKKGKKNKCNKTQERKFSPTQLVKQPNWNYKGQGNWSQDFPFCGGLRQSPISIPVQLLVHTKGARDLCFDNFDVLPTALSVCVGECRLTMVGQWELKHWPTVYGGAAHSRRYKFYSMSAMWPSEHKIEGMLYPMETQFMFIGVEYATLDDALAAVMKDPQALLTIATLYKFGKALHNGSADLLQSAMVCKKCKCRNQELKPLSYFCPPFKKYATYYGSLPTPPCTESVLWLIRARALNVTWDMYQNLLRVSTAGAFFTRDTQQLNDRKLFFFD